MTKLANGLWLINFGIVGEPNSGDNISDLVYKLNQNFEIILTNQDNLAGEGLRMAGQKLELDTDYPDFVNLDLEDTSSFDLSTVTNNSTIYIKNTADSTKTLNFLNLGEVAIGNSYSLFFNVVGSIVNHFQGVNFLSPQDSAGEIFITESNGLTITKLEDELWGIIS